MAEVKVRLSAATTAASGGLRVHQLVAYELCYLELRMICELIALSCLVVHGDVPGTSTGRMRKAYDADFILNALEELHPDFYPRPGVQVDGGREVKPVTSGFLTKQMLIRLYGECGNVLHRGSIRNIGPELNKPRSFERIADWLSKLVKLLDHHQITLLNSDLEVWTVMHASQDGQPHVHLMKRLGPTTTQPGARKARSS
jgi:hypothetical protein